MQNKSRKSAKRIIPDKQDTDEASRTGMGKHTSRMGKTQRKRARRGV